MKITKNDTILSCNFREVSFFATDFVKKAIDILKKHGIIGIGKRFSCQNAGFGYKSTEVAMPQAENAETIRLLKAVAARDDSAFVTLENAYRPLMQKLASFYAQKAKDPHTEDWLQEAEIAFIQAVRTYRCEQQEVTFGLYAKILIRNRLISYLRKRSKLQTVQLDVVKNGNSPYKVARVATAPDPLAHVIAAERINQLLTQLEPVLSPYEMKVFQFYLQGEKPRRIALALGKSAKSVDNALCRLKSKIKLLAGSSDFRFHMPE